MAYMIDREEVVAAIKRVIERYSSGEEHPTGVDLVLNFVKAEMLIEILKIDPKDS